jgi:hypothetical protein
MVTLSADSADARIAPVTARRTPPLLAFALIAALLAACNAGAPPPPADQEVHGMEYGQFMWAGGGAPTVPIGPIEPGAVREDVERAGAVLDDKRDADFPMEIIALFPNGNEAEAHANEVRTILHDSAAWYADPAHAADRAALDDPDKPPPLIPPEADAMRANLLAAGTRGIGWGGGPDDAAAAVRTLGPLLFVTGLKGDHWATDVPPVHPLAHLLAAQGADVREAGGELDDGAAVDVSCHVDDPAVGRRLRDDIGDAMVGAAAYDARPPWIGPPITDEERLARTTLARWSAGFAAAFQDADTQVLAQRLLAAATAEERAAAMKDFERKILSDSSRMVVGEIDPNVLALLLQAPDNKDADVIAAWRSQMGAALAALATHDVDGVSMPAEDDMDRLAIFGSTRLHGDRLEMSSLAFNRFSAGFPSLAAFLTDNGCDDLKFGLVKAAP